LATRVYVDTWLLRAFVSNNKHDASDARRELSKLRSSSFEAVIPQIVIGEAVSTILRDFSQPNDIHNKLSKLYDELQPILNFRQCMPPISMLIVNQANELKQKDGNLKDTDAIIASHALLDPQSQRLLTSDTDLLNSRVVIQVEEELRGSGIRRQKLKVVDGL